MRCWHVFSGHAPTVLPDAAAHDGQSCALVRGARSVIRLAVVPLSGGLGERSGSSYRYPPTVNIRKGLEKCPAAKLWQGREDEPCAVK